MPQLSDLQAQDLQNIIKSLQNEFPDIPMQGNAVEAANQLKQHVLDLTREQKLRETRHRDAMAKKADIERENAQRKAVIAQLQREIDFIKLEIEAEGDETASQSSS
jgi:hypothetical protein